MPSTGHARAALGRPGPSLRGARWYAAADAVMFAGLLNLLVVVFTIAGAVVFGWAPALAAATACTRRRLLGRATPVVRTFAREWRQRFVHANLLLALPALALALCGSSLVALQGRPTSAPLVIALWAAAGLCLAHLVLAVTMDAHYDLGRGRCLWVAWAFMLRFPGAPLLLAATTVLIAVATVLVPGLLPVISIGAWISLCTALCLSLFAANERALERDAPPRPARPAATD